MRTKPEHSRAAAKLGALGSAVVLGTFVVMNHVEEASKAANEIGSSLKRMAALMDEIVDTQQSSSTKKVSEALRQMDAVTQQNSDFLREAAATAKAMKEHAQSVARVLANDASGMVGKPDRRKRK